MSKYASRRVGPWGLTRAEAETIKLVAEGLRLSEIAEVKGRSSRTTESHATSARSKMAVQTLAHAAVLYDRWASSQSAGVSRSQSGQNLPGGER